MLLDLTSAIILLLQNGLGDDEREGVYQIMISIKDKNGPKKQRRKFTAL